MPFLDENAKEMVQKKGGQWSPLIFYRSGLARQDDDEDGMLSYIGFSLHFEIHLLPLKITLAPPECQNTGSCNIDCNFLSALDV